jgi:3-deoxy-D-arabino-heptulosonate 7-phosphate (DAHP) synthase class II
MHGNTRLTASGGKTRWLDDVLAELRAFLAIQDREGVPAGGIHLETTPETVVECADLGSDPADQPAIETLCDPRLNARQAMRVALELVDVYASRDAGEAPNAAR